MASLDQGIVAELRDIMEDEFQALVDTYLEDAIVRIDAIGAAHGSQDPNALREAAHSFKGASVNIGALPLSELCETVEHMARDGDISGVDVYIQQIQHEFDSVKAALQESSQL